MSEEWHGRKVLNLILEKIQKINPDNFPLILTGDFNMEHTDSSIQN